MNQNQIILKYILKTKSKDFNRNPTKTILQDYYTSLTNQTSSNSLKQLIQDFEELSISNRFKPKRDSAQINNYSVLSDIVLTSFTNLIKNQTSKQLIQQAKTKQDLKIILLIDQLPQQESNNQDLNTLCANLLRKSYAKRKSRDFERFYQEYNNKYMSLQQLITKESFFQLYDLNIELSNKIKKIRNLRVLELNKILQDLSELKSNFDTHISNNFDKIREDIKVEEIQSNFTLEEQLNYLTKESEYFKKLEEISQIYKKPFELENKKREIERQLRICQDLNKQYQGLKEENQDLKEKLDYLNKDTVAEIENLSLPEIVLRWYENIGKEQISINNSYHDISESIQEHESLTRRIQGAIQGKIYNLKNKLNRKACGYELGIKYKEHLKNPKKVREYTQGINEILESCKTIEDYIDLSKTTTSLVNMLNQLERSYIGEIRSIAYKGVEYSLIASIFFPYAISRYILFPVGNFIYKKINKT